MKKYLFFYSICLGLALKPLSTQACQYYNETMPTNEICIIQQSSESDTVRVIRFIEDFYANCVFGATDQIPTLKKHCTSELLKKLRDHYCYDGEGYAIWDFRSGAQDGPSDISKVMSVTVLGNDSYKVNFIDMGIKGCRILKIVNESGVLKFDGIE